MAQFKRVINNFVLIVFYIVFFIGLVTKKYLISFVILIPIGFIIDLIIRGKKWNYTVQTMTF